MNKFFITFATIVALCTPVLASAGTVAARTKVESGWSHVMCSLETDVDEGCDADGAEGIFAVVDMYDTVTFTLIDAGTSSSVCEIHAGTTFDDVPGTSDLSTLGGDKINSTSLADAQERIQFNNISYKYLWVVCSVADASSTVIMQGSVGSNRIGR